ncbi:MAG: sensor histidine kinase [Azonexus sp.]|jgi:signal transduction histidine kinase|nr:sensor histidine kinase [Azonexus sp.]
MIASARFSLPLPLLRPVFWRCLLWFMLALPLPTFAAQVGDATPLLAPHAAFLCDSGGQLSVDEVAARAADFQPMPETLSRGYTKDACWLRLTLPDDIDRQGDYWLEAPPLVLDDVRLYEQTPQGGWLARRSGDTVAFAAHEGPYRAASFRLTNPQPGAVIYLRVETTSTLAVSPRLWRGEALRAANDAALLGFGLYFGFMLAVALFNFMSWLLWRETVYGAFALGVTVVGLRWFFADGLADQFLFPHDAALTNQLANALVGLLTFFVTLYQAMLLQLKGNFPRLLYFYRLVMAMGLWVALSPLLGGYSQVATVIFVCAMIAPFLSLPAYWRLWRSGEVANRLIAVSIPAYFVIMVPNYLGTLGFIPYLPEIIGNAHLGDLPLVLALHLSLVLKARELERARNLAQKRAEDAIAVSERERTARAEQNRFLAMITHEVRTPVAIIDAATHSLHLLDEIGSEPAQRDKRYQNIAQAVTRMKALMELAEVQERFSAAEPTAKIPMAAVDLAQLSTETLAAFDPDTAARVTLNAAGPLPAITGNARLLYFVFLNLLDNAVKYAEPETPIRIDIYPALSGRGLVWSIRDYGAGIPDGKEEAIFEKYRRLDETASKPGLGLGLSLAREIIESHGGQLRLDSRWTDGACFVIWLPEAP